MHKECVAHKNFRIYLGLQYALIDPLLIIDLQIYILSLLGGSTNGENIAICNI